MDRDRAEEKVRKWLKKYNEEIKLLRSSIKYDKSLGISRDTFPVKVHRGAANAYLRRAILAAERGGL